MIDRWELCTFNNLCKDKYLRLGKAWPLIDTKLIDKNFIIDLTNIAKKSGVNPDIVTWSGVTEAN